MLSIWGTGTDNVDLDAAARHGVTVTNTPGVVRDLHRGARAGADAGRGAPHPAPGRDGCAPGEWPRGQMTQLHGKTLGIIGLGAIGRKFARLGEAIGMRVIAWTMHPDPALGFTLVELDDLLRSSDVVSLHLRLSDQTRGFLGARELALMKPSAILINTARGPIVDEAALLDALAIGPAGRRGAGCLRDRAAAGRSSADPRWRTSCSRRIRPASRWRRWKPGCRWRSTTSAIFWPAVLRTL